MIATSSLSRYPQLFSWLDLIDFNVFFILMLMTVVAGFNMISGLLIMLFENISTIGLLKSLGMTDRGITGVFMSTFILCPEPGISSFFRRMTAQLRVFFSRNNLSYYSRWYTNPAGNLSVRVCMFRRGGVWTPCLYYRQGMSR